MRGKALLKTMVLYIKYVLLLHSCFLWYMHDWSSLLIKLERKWLWACVNQNPSKISSSEWASYIGQKRSLQLCNIFHSSFLFTFKHHKSKVYWVTLNGYISLPGHILYVGLEPFCLLMFQQQWWHQLGVERHGKQLQTYPYHIEVQQCASSQQHSKPDQMSEAIRNPKRYAETTLSTPSHKVKV